MNIQIVHASLEKDWDKVYSKTLNTFLFHFALRISRWCKKLQKVPSQNDFFLKKGQNGFKKTQKLNADFQPEGI